MSRGDGSNVSTTPPFGTRLVTETLPPPTWWTMSARTVVVATTRSAPGCCVGLPAGPAVQAVSSKARPSITTERVRATRCSRVIGSGRGAGGAPPEQFETVAVDREPGPPLDRPDDVADPAIVDLGRAPAVLADHVVVMGRLAGDVGVVAVREVDPLDDVELHERVNRPEDGRPPDAQAAGLRVREEVGGGKRALAARDQ